MTRHAAIAQELEPELIAWRRHLHQHPELGFEEIETTRFLEELLTRWGVPYTKPLKTGLVAELKGNRPGSTVALRADIDALPILEETGLPFASQNEGKMHACGHDGHTAILLGVVRAFLAMEGDFPGTVRFLFQPAEEGPGGGEPLVKAGALDGVQAVYGLHLWSSTPTGKGEITPGPMMAATDSARITIQGRGGHGAEPHKTVDSVLVAASLVMNLQTIVARRIDPLKSAVITVGEVHAGGAANVIADTAVLTLTIRSLEDGVRDQLEAEIHRVADETAKAYGASAQVDYERGYPPLVNDPAATEALKAAAERVLGSGAVAIIPPVMGGEDFAYYTQKAKGAFLFLGAGGAGYAAHHHPKFTIDEAALKHGVAILTDVALAELEGRA